MEVLLLDPPTSWRTGFIPHARVQGLGAGFGYFTAGVPRTLGPPRSAHNYPLAPPGSLFEATLVGDRERAYYHIHFCLHLWFRLSAFMQPDLGTHMSNIRSLP